MVEQLIPRIFHRMWLGSKPMPDEFVEYGNTWLHHHPGWEMKLWNEENLIALQNQEAFDKASHVVQKADIASYELIYNFGGIYIDCDFECLKNIEPLLGGIEAFSASEMAGLVSHGIMGCVPKNPIFKQLVDGIPGSISANKHLPMNYQTGPHFITRIVKERADFTVFGPELFYPYLYTEKYRKGEKFPNAYAVHHWAGSWL